MTEQHEPIIGPIAKVTAAILGWLGGIQLADVQVVVAIISGLCVGTYAALQAYVLIRDKIMR